MAQGEHESARCTTTSVARSMNILDATLTRIARDSLSRSRPPVTALALSLARTRALIIH